MVFSGKNLRSFKEAQAITSNDWLGASLVFELGEHEKITKTGNESQIETGSTDDTVRRSINLLEEAGIVSVSGGSVSLTERGYIVHEKMINMMAEGK